MTNEKMEQRLAAALEKTAPDDVNGVPFLIVEVLSSVRIPQLHQAEIPADRQDPSHR